ncbi:MAG: penicillin-binding protein 2 [bacterium]|nr:penicillin-binding protein 2 [bacterium]
MEKQQKIIKGRIKIIEKIIGSLFFVLILALINTICFQKEKFEKKLVELTAVIIEGESAPRGRIYDRNYNLLVDNESVPIIYYQKEKNTTIKEEIALAYQVLEHLEIDASKLTERNLKEFWLANHSTEAQNKITKEEYEKRKRRILNDSDLENLKISRITKEELAEYDEQDRKAAYIYYLMNKGYSYEQKIIKEDNVSDIEFLHFSENNQTLKGFNTKITWKRKYLYGDTIKSILGSVGSIPKEQKDEYLKKGYELTDQVGISNIEKQYEDILKGTKAQYLKKSNNSLEKISEAKRGNDLVLTIDITLQQEVERIIDERLIKAKSEANTKYLNKTYVVIQQPNTGEVLAMSGRKIIKIEDQYQGIDITPYALTDPMTPGSVVKGASILVGYANNVLQIGEVMSDECIKLKNIPAKCSSRYLGRINDITALAESSNVYQFRIAMRVAKAEYSYNASITIDDEAFDIYRNMFASFGLGVKTQIDLPVESLGYIGKKQTPDLLLNFSIGQYDTYTPIQLSQYITTIASNGKRIQPHLLKAVYESTRNDRLGKLAYEIEPIILSTVEVDQEYLKRMQEGLRAVMTVGLGKNVMGKSPNPAGKTGTSESFLDTDGDGVIDTETVSNAFVGYAPYEAPVMSITVTSPDVSYLATNTNYHSYVNRLIARYISNRYFELYPNGNETT